MLYYPQDTPEVTMGISDGCVLVASWLVSPADAADDLLCSYRISDQQKFCRAHSIFTTIRRQSTDILSLAAPLEEA